MTGPLNVLHLTTFYPPYSFGGDAMYIYRLSHALAGAGHHVEVIHCVDSYHLLHPAEPEISFAEHPNVRRHELRSPLGPLSPLLTQQTGMPALKRGKIRQVMDSRPWDVIHYHNISLLGPGVLKMNPAGDRRVKLYTTHEHWLVCPTHVLWKFGERACEKPECFRCTLKAGRPPQLWRYTGMLAEAARHVDQFVSPSRFTARMHAERGFSQPVGHLPYFIDRADTDWQNPGPRPQEKPYFLFVGRLEWLKGLQTLIAAWPKAGDFDLLVAGAGTDAERLKSLAAFDTRIKFLGPRTQIELGALYYHALACLVPSVTYETFGIVMIESFARKTPVVARDLGALPEVIAESRGGLVYRTDLELIAALQKIASSPDLRRELGENGYRAFLDRWTREAHLDLYLNLVNNTALKKYGEPIR